MWVVTSLRELIRLPAMRCPARGEENDIAMLTLLVSTTVCKSEGTVSRKTSYMCEELVNIAMRRTGTRQGPLVWEATL